MVSHWPFIKRVYYWRFRSGLFLGSCTFWSIDLWCVSLSLTHGYNEPSLQTTQNVRPHGFSTLSRKFPWFSLSQSILLNPIFGMFTARNEVGARLYFHRHVWFCSQGGAWSWGGCLVLGGEPGPGGGCLVPGGRCLVLGGPGPGGLVETPRDGYCCGRYASYWNAFLFMYVFPVQ